MSKIENYKFKDYTVKGHTFTVRFEKRKDIFGYYVDVVIYEQYPHPTTRWERLKMAWKYNPLSSYNYWRGNEYDITIDKYVEDKCSHLVWKQEHENFVERQWDEV